MTLELSRQLVEGDVNKVKEFMCLIQEERDTHSAKEWRSNEEVEKPHMVPGKGAQNEGTSLKPPKPTDYFVFLCFVKNMTKV